MHVDLCCMALLEVGDGRGVGGEGRWCVVVALSLTTTENKIKVGTKVNFNKQWFLEAFKRRIFSLNVTYILRKALKT